MSAGIGEDDVGVWSDRFAFVVLFAYTSAAEADTEVAFLALECCDGVCARDDNGGERKREFGCELFIKLFLFAFAFVWKLEKGILTATSFKFTIL